MQNIWVYSHIWCVCVRLCICLRVCLCLAPPLLPAVFHPVECSYCHTESMMGFRYRCQQCHNYQLCQDCFWRGHASGSHSNQHQMKEYTSWVRKGGKGGGGKGWARGGVSTPDQSLWLFLFCFATTWGIWRFSPGDSVTVVIYRVLWKTNEHPHILTTVTLLLCITQKSPAKKLSHALSKSLSCASSREPLHPLFPEMPDKPLNLAHIV